MCLQFVSKQRHEKSIEEAGGEEQHSAGDGSEREEGAKHVEEQQQQDGPVAGQRAQAQPGLPDPLQHVLGCRTLLSFGGAIGIR